MEATTQERNFQSQLNQGRQENAANKITATNDTGTSPNPIVVIFMAGVALVADIVEVPIIGWLIDGIALGILWLWRVLKHQVGPKKDVTFQLLLALLIELSGPLAIIPSWTIFVLYTYAKDTKLGKATIGKAEKLAKVT